jgi:uncharacterized SAM-binding protein YcdF (DUF218 family)
VIFIAAVAALVATYPAWLAAPAVFLVRVDEPFAADIIVVLAGDYTGGRIVKGAQLAAQGLAPRVLVSSTPAEIYGSLECQLAIAFVERLGHPSHRFECLRHEGTRTADEAAVVVAELIRRGVQRFMVVTTDYHTRRVGLVYRALARGVEFRVIGVAAPDFRARSGGGRRRHGSGSRSNR